jgi:hypothetical protein
MLHIIYNHGYRLLVRNPLGKQSLGRPKRKWEASIEEDPDKTDCQEGTIVDFGISHFESLGSATRQFIYLVISVKYAFNFVYVDMPRVFILISSRYSFVTHKAQN